MAIPADVADDVWGDLMLALGPCSRHGEDDFGISYGQFDEWAAAMARTHDQRKCPGCGRWRLWVRRA